MAAHRVAAGKRLPRHWAARRPDRGDGPRAVRPNAAPRIEPLARAGRRPTGIGKLTGPEGTPGAMATTAPERGQQREARPARGARYGRLEVARRRATPDDAARFAAWRAEPSMRRFRPLRSRTPAELRAELAAMAAVSVDPTIAGKVRWVIEADGEPVGWVSLRVVDREHGLGGVGYAVTERASRPSPRSGTVPRDGCWRRRASPSRVSPGVPRRQRRAGRSRPVRPAAGGLVPRPPQPRAQRSSPGTVGCVRTWRGRIPPPWEPRSKGERARTG